MHTLAESFADWASGRPEIEALTLFGSRARADARSAAGSDAHSDWDFQVITSEPWRFNSGEWARCLPAARLRVYAPRMTRFGGVPKVNMIFEGAEADLVVIPSRPLKAARLLVSLGLHRREGYLRRRLRDLAVTLRPGWTFLKGAQEWDAFYRRVVAEVDDPRTDDREALRLADVFICDYVWALRKIERGEWIAAQRMLHRELSETNLQLFHELRLRRGERSYPEGRRVEQLCDPAQVGRLVLASSCNERDLRAALSVASDTLRHLMKELVGPLWEWPADLS